MADKFEQIPIPDDGAPENPSRRKFLKKAFRTGVTAGVGGGIAAKVISIVEEEKKKGIKEQVAALRTRLHDEALDKEEVTKIEQKEEVPVEITPFEQLEEWGEVRDMASGIEAIEDEHYRKLIGTEKGQGDLRAMAQNIARLDMKKIARPYRGLGLPEELAYMIAIQETRARNLTSSAGAKGVTGLMPATIKSMNFKQEDVSDPYKANILTAHYFATERDERFGDDIDLLLHAYNAGGGLFGYTQTKRYKKDRNIDDFYSYLQEYVNKRYKKVESDVTEKGYFMYTLERGDKTLTQVSRKFHVPLGALLEENDFTQEAPIHSGESIRIPCKDPMQATKYLLRKPFEAIRYAPEVKAKYRALKEIGETEKIEIAMRDD